MTTEVSRPDADERQLDDADHDEFYAEFHAGMKGDHPEHRPGPWELWAEISHSDAALQTQSRAFNGLVGTLAPEGERSLLGWRHRVLTLRDEDFINADLLTMLDASYQSRQDVSIEAWRENAISNLCKAARDRRSSPVALAGWELDRIRKYYERSLDGLLDEGIFDDPAKLRVLSGRVELYRTFMHHRRDYEHSLEGYASRFDRWAMLLGASAVRGAYHKATGLLSYPIYWAYTLRHKYNVTPMEIRQGRRFKAYTIAALATIGLIAASRAKIVDGLEWVGEQAGEVAADVNDFLTPDDQSLERPSENPSVAEQPDPKDDLPPKQVPPQEPVTPQPTFSEDAKTIEHGESLTQTIREVVPGITDTQNANLQDAIDDQLAKVHGNDGHMFVYEGPDGKQRLNEGDGTAPTEALQIIQNEAANKGLLGSVVAALFLRRRNVRRRTVKR